MATTGLTHTVGLSYKTDAGTISTVTSAVVGDEEFNYDGPIAAGAVNAHIVAAIAHATLISVCLYCDQAITIKTNSSGSPEETITIAAKAAVIWNNVMPTTMTCPFSGDITGFYVSNPGTVAANLKIRALSQA